MVVGGTVTHPPQTWKVRGSIPAQDGQFSEILSSISCSTSTGSTQEHEERQVKYWFHPGKTSTGSTQETVPVYRCYTPSTIKNQGVYSQRARVSHPDSLYPTSVSTRCLFSKTKDPIGNKCLSALSWVILDRKVKTTTQKLEFRLAVVRICTLNATWQRCPN